MSNVILLVNGPNLNLLGAREPATYGYDTLETVESMVKEVANASGTSALCFQSNSEGAIVDRIHAARAEGVKGIVINPGAYTHTSVAIRDALVGVSIPFIELHISNVHQREAFRHHSYLSDKAVAVICGLGIEGYRTFHSRLIAFSRLRNLKYTLAASVPTTGYAVMHMSKMIASKSNAERV